MPSSGQPDLFESSEIFGTAFSWASITLAVFTAICQGLVAALTFMTESSAQWTFRFRLALYEHWWWTAVSVLLFISLAMSAVAFASGNGGDPVSVLALSSATFLAMVQYMLPAWKQRHYTLTRWYAWTGDSRTAIKQECALLCKDASTWAKLARRCRSRLSTLQPTSSDYYGWRLWPLYSIPDDPTDIFRVIKKADVDMVEAESGKEPVGVYPNFDGSSPSVSLLWGRKQNFRRRVSRAVSSMPLTLLRSSPRTADGYDGRGLAIAMGILGRNKGLQPWKLVYESNSQVSTLLENSSTWTPRPSKVLRSFYKQTLNGQYGGLGEGYVNAAVELALLCLDVPSNHLDSWLTMGWEHQSPDVGNMLDRLAVASEGEVGRAAAVSAHYESSYVAMIVSLNAMNISGHIAPGPPAMFKRPEIICAGLLMKSRGLPEPAWWQFKEIQAARQIEIDSMSGEVDWKTAAANLIGLSRWPVGFEDGPSVWEAKEDDKNKEG